MLLGVLVAFLLVQLGCSAEHLSASATIKVAKTAFSEAKAVDAEKKASFQYYSAEIYLKQASDLLLRGNTDAATVMATRSLNYSRMALYISGIYSPATQGQ